MTPTPSTRRRQSATRSPQAGYVTIKVYNLLGKEIAALISERQSAGEHEVRWNVPSLPSGIYFYRLQAGGFTATRKMLLVR
ncbi:MAG: T9SS type A sorting domain-containing protein [bacterium]